MNIDVFYHICRACIKIAETEYITVYGSNSVVYWLDKFGSSLSDVIEDRLIYSDLNVSVKDDDKISTVFDAAIGKLNQFHKTFNVV